MILKRRAQSFPHTPVEPSRSPEIRQQTAQLARVLAVSVRRDGQTVIDAWRSVPSLSPKGTGG